MIDAVIVGGGLFGSIINAQLLSLGFDTLLIDGAHPFAGSNPSASLIKPSWLNSMRTEDVDNGFRVLDDLYNVADLSFKVGPLKFDSVRWVDPRKIMNRPYHRGHVRSAEPGRVVIDAKGRDLLVVEATNVILAGGMWCNDLLSRSHKVPGLEGKAGGACFFRDTRLGCGEYFIRPWAPYKQLIGFNLGPDIWIGDGSAIKVDNWTRDRAHKTLERCQRALPLELAQRQPTRDFIQGYRPYVPKKHLGGDPCYLRNPTPGLWVATGGAKNGTIAAGWAAHTIGKALT